jgi:GNAT superfamily N-acetyltransferase
VTDGDSFGNSGCITIPEAASTDERRLREIAFAAKAGWGYERDRVAEWVDTLRLFGAVAPRAEIYLVERDGDLVGWMRLIPKDGFCVLEDLWVEPTSQRGGIGSTLFRLAEDRARALGAQWLEWEAEPNAIGFYERRRGRHIRTTAPNEWGRVLQVMAVNLGDESV